VEICTRLILPVPGVFHRRPGLSPGAGRASWPPGSH
jgi:hypothetical protein